MATVRTIPDKGAVIAWSPIKELGDFIAVGTKEGGGGGFEDYGGDLSVYSAELASTGSECRHVCSVKTSARFSSLAWTSFTPKGSTDGQSNAGNAGLLAGGMADGTIIVWDVGKLLSGEGEQAMLAVIERQAAPVRALQFNPHPQSRHLLGAGSSDGDISIIDLSNPSQPTIATPLSAGTKLDHEITAVAWNTAVTHILATATLGGVVVVWDLKENRPWCSLKDPHRAPIADVVWHPEDGLYLATACDDDARPVLRVWDLRSSTNVPLAELSGHTKGVVSLDWCPADPALLISCGKDGHTFIWDIIQGRAVADITSGGSGPAATPAVPARPATAADTFGGAGAAGVFGAPPGSDAAGVFGSTLGGLGGIGASAGRRYLVRWSRKCPAYFAACSFDRRVTIHSAAAWGPDQLPRIPGPYGAAPEPNVRRAPKWLRRSVGATFGFGGKLVTFAAPAGATSSSLRAQAYQYPKVLQVCKTSTDLDFTTRAGTFEGLWLRLLAGEYDVHAMCTYLAGQATASGDVAAAGIWQLLAAVSAPDQRAALLTYLGYDSTTIQGELGAYTAQHAGGASGHSASLPAPVKQEVHEQAPPQLPEPLAQPHHDMHHGHQATEPSYGGFGGAFGQPPADQDANALFGAGSAASAEDFFSGNGLGTVQAEAVPQQVEDVTAHTDDMASPPTDVEPHGHSGEEAKPLTQPEASVHSSGSAVQAGPGERVVVVRGAPEDDDVLRRALVVGDFASAVSVCLAQGRLDDALLLASVGAPDLWERTKEEFFRRKAAQAGGAARVMAAVVPHVLNGSLADMVARSDLAAWRETLALACTYGKVEEFAGLAQALGDRLVNEVGDRASATICYMASPAPDRAVELLIQRLADTSRSTGRLPALMSFAEVVMVFRRVAAMAPAGAAQAQDGSVPSQAEAPFLAELALLLADEGTLPTASLFASQISATASVGPEGINVGDVVRDRLLRAFDRHEYAQPSAAFIQAQPFPYPMLQVNPCTGFIQRQAAPTPAASAIGRSHVGLPAPGPGPMASAADVFGGGGFGGAPSGMDASFSSTGHTMGYGDQGQGYGQPQQMPGQYGHQLDGMTGQGHMQQQQYGQPAMQQSMPTAQPAYAAQQQMGYGQPMQQAPATAMPGYGAPHAQQQMPQVPSQAYQAAPMAPAAVARPGPSMAPAVPPTAAHAVPAQPMGWQPGPATAPAPVAAPQAAPYSQAPHGGMMQAPAQAPPAMPAAAPAAALPDGFQDSIAGVYSLIPMLQGLQLNAVERKQLDEAGQALETLRSKAVSGSLKPDVAGKFVELSAALTAYDFKRGAKLQSELAGMEWNQTKEWIRGVRNLVTLCLTKSGK